MYPISITPNLEQRAERYIFERIVAARAVVTLATLPAPTVSEPTAPVLSNHVSSGSRPRRSLLLRKTCPIWDAGSPTTPPYNPDEALRSEITAGLLFINDECKLSRIPASPSR
jgi:hypothetical protein